jgi:hypothetical protein
VAQLQLYATELIIVTLPNGEKVESCHITGVGGCTLTPRNHHYIFQLDSTPAYESKRTQDWLKGPDVQLQRCRRGRSGLPAHLIPTLFAIFECGKSELWVTAKSCNKTKDLIQKTKEVMGSFNRDTMAKACKS